MNKISIVNIFLGKLLSNLKSLILVLVVICCAVSNLLAQVQTNDLEIDQQEYKSKYRIAVQNGDISEQANLLRIIVKDYNAKNNWDSVYLYNELLAAAELNLGNKEGYLSAFMVNLSIDEISNNNIVNHKAKIDEIAKYMNDAELSGFRRGEIARFLAKYVFYNIDRDSSILILNKAIEYAEMPGVDKAYALGHRTQKAAFLNGMGRNEEAINELIYVVNNESFTFEPALKRWYVLDQLAELFLDIQDYSKAEEYFNKAIRLADENNYVSSAADSKKEYARSKLIEGKIEESQLLLDQCIDVFKRKEKNRELVNSYSIYAKSYLSIKNLEAAKAKLDSADAYFTLVDKSTSTTNKDAIKASLELVRLEYLIQTESYDEIPRILNIVDNSQLFKNYPNLKIKVDYVKYLLEKSRNNSANSLQYYERYIQQRDSLDAKNSAMRVHVIESEFNRQEQNSTIATLDAVTKEQDASLSLRNRALVIGSIMLAFLVGLLIGLYRLFRKNKEYQSKLEIQNVTIQKALAENKVLIKEIHHRVKNNLQVISSLLSLQERKVTDENTKEALRSSKTRVETMSILHQSLYQGDEVRGIGVKEYFTDLVNNLIDTYTVNDKITTNIDIDDLKIDVDSLIPLGLVANELICNAIKHGIGNELEGEISIALKDRGDKIVLTVEDSGAKLSTKYLEVKKGSLGVKLIKAFANRLDGELLVETDRTTKISMLVNKENINFINE